MLRTRLFLNLLPFVVMLLATGLFAIALFSRLASSVDATVAQNYRSVVAAQQMNSALRAMEQEGWAATMARNPDKQLLGQYQRRFEDNLALQVNNNSLPGEQDLNRQLTNDYQAFRAALAHLNSSSDSENKHLVYDQEFVPRALQMKGILDTIQELSQQAILATSGQVKQITSEVTRLMVVGIVIALIISTYACYQLSRAVLRPIQLVTNATRELGEGNLGQPVPVISSDELGELAMAFNKMAAQLAEYRQSTSAEIVRLHRTMETTLATFPDPIFVLNDQGRIELANPAGADLMGGLQLSGQLPNRLQAAAKNCLASGQDFLPDSFKEVVSYKFNGAEKYFLPRILTMRTKEGGRFGVAVVLYDVTRFRLLDAAKSDLVATVSHELKTPLTSVRMALHILLEHTLGNLSAKQDEILQAARWDTERLLRILNDLLDLARLEGSNPELRRENVSPAELIQAALADTADKAAVKAIALKSSVEADLPAVWVDRQRISHVFTNLLTNAIKHSPQGGEIFLRAARAEDEGVQFSVSDQGPGIPEEYQTRIFDRFFRVPGQSKTGAGLGLSIAKEITVAHGGVIGVKSWPGRGSVFYVILKSAGGAQATASQAQAA